MIENSAQDCLSYILISNSLCKLFLAYSKWPYICLKVNLCFIHIITSSFSEYSTFFYASCDLWLLPCYLMWLMCNWVMLLLTLTLSPKNWKIKIKIKEKEKENKNKKIRKKLSLLLVILTKRVSVMSKSKSLWEE